MSRFVSFIILVVALNHSRAQSNIDVLHYKFEIELSDRSDTIKGRAFVTVRFIQSSDSFWLSLTSPIKGKGMHARLVQENGKPLTSLHRNDTLSTMLGSPAKKNEERTFEILYSGVPSDGLIISRNKYGDRTFFADNWPNRAHHWIPCKDEPGDKATFEFIVTAPAQYNVVSNGKLEEQTDLPDNKKLTHWSEDVALSTKVMVIGVAKFAVKTFVDSPPNIPVSAWVYPQDSLRGFRNYSIAPSILKFYSGYIGPYPYNKLANVQSKTIFGGMENASAIFYYQQSAEENKSLEDIIAHEIAHQWFGDMVSEKSFAHLWLSEGFATYLTNIYIESKYGTDSMNKRLVSDRKMIINFIKHSNRPVVDSLSTLMSLLNENSYQKGSWVLHMLRKEIGDSLFHLFIQTYYEYYKGKNANTDDLEKIVEKISHKDLRQFFKQWLYAPGIPRLDIQWGVTASNELSLTVTQTQNEIFQFPLQVAIEPEGETAKIVTIQISGRTETFKFSTEKKSLHLSIDPNIFLLFEGKIEKLDD